MDQVHTKQGPTPIQMKKETSWVRPKSSQVASPISQGIIEVK